MAWTCTYCTDFYLGYSKDFYVLYSLVCLGYTFICGIYFYPCVLLLHHTFERAILPECGIFSFVWCVGCFFSFLGKEAGISHQGTINILQFYILIGKTGAQSVFLAVCHYILFTFQSEMTWVPPYRAMTSFSRSHSFTNIKGRRVDLERPWTDHVIWGWPMRGLKKLHREGHINI